MGEKGHHAGRTFIGHDGRLDLNGSALSGLLRFAPAQAIDMADDQLALSVDAAATQLTSNILYVDPNSGGATEDLLLPPEADADGLMLIINNTGGEGIVVKDDSDTATIATIDTAQVAIVWCDGTAWGGGIMPKTEGGTRASQTQHLLGGPQWLLFRWRHRRRG